MANSFLGIPGLPVGLRNNNPGNLRPLSGGQKWQGELSADLVNNFSRFSDVGWGIRAMITDIMGDIVIDKKNTIRLLVSAYAPPSENDTQAYINNVARQMGISQDAPISTDRQTIERLIRAKMNVELGASNAAKISAADISEGFDRLGETARKWLGSPSGSDLTTIALIALGFWVYKRFL